MAQSHAAGKLLEHTVRPGFCTSLLVVDMHDGRADVWKSAEEYAMLLTLLTTLATPDSPSGKLLKALRHTTTLHTFGALAWCTPGEDRDLNAWLKTLIRPGYVEDAKYLLSYPERYRLRGRVPLLEMIAWPDDSAVYHAKPVKITPVVAPPVPVPSTVRRYAARPVMIAPVAVSARPKLDGVNEARAEAFEQWQLKVAEKGALGSLKSWVRDSVKRHLQSVRAAKPNEFGFIRLESRRPDTARRMSDGRVAIEAFPSKQVFMKPQDATGKPSVICISRDTGARPETTRQGSFKQVVEETSGKLVFSPRRNEVFARPRVAADRYGDLRNIIPSIAVSRQYMYARNGGETLERYLQTGDTPYLRARDFLPLVQDLDDLHARGLYHLDIKPANMTVRVDSSSKRVRGVALIDTDGITGVTPDIIWSAGMMPFSLKQRMLDAEVMKFTAEGRVRRSVRPDETLIRAASEAGKNAAAAFSAADQYALLLTMIASCGPALNGWFWTVVMLNKRGLPLLSRDLRGIESWLADNVKAEYREEIRQLLKRPESTTLSVPLAAVFKK